MKKRKNIPFFKKYINGTKGVISIFLALLMVPFTMIAGALINAGRINSAVAIFDEALCNASNSTLGTYDEFLRSRFALMAVSQDTSKGAEKFGVPAKTYTADQFISDLFEYYMEQNVGALSNTYDSQSVSAMGVHPLADPAILKDAINETCRVPIAARLLVDWFSIDDIINELTKSMKMVTNIENLVSSGSKVIADLDKINDKQATLETKIDECNTAKSECETAYTNFANAVNSFNTLVGNINTTAGNVATYQRKVDTYAAQVTGYNNQIQAKQNEITELKKDGVTEAEKAKITTLEEEITALEEARDEVAPDYTDYCNLLKNAKSDLQEYKDDFPDIKQAVINKKNTYYSKVETLRNKVNATGEAADAFKQAITTAITDGSTVIKDSVALTTGALTAANKKKKEQLEEQGKEIQRLQTEAENAGNADEARAYAEAYQNNLNAQKELGKELASKDLSNENIKTLGDNLDIAFKKTINDLDGLTDRDLVEEYGQISSALDSVLDRLTNEFKVPESYTTIPFNEKDYKVTFEQPITKAGLSDLMEKLDEEIAKSAGISALKSMVDFLLALVKVDTLWDPMLTSEINTNLYKPIGGLPSSKSFPITSSVEAEDAKLSQEYKELLNSYSSETVYITVDPTQQLLDQIYKSIDGIVNACKGDKPFSIKNLSNLYNHIKTLVSSAVQYVQRVVNNGIENLRRSIMNNFYTIGYISYGTANRTTYAGKTFMGERFGLPSSGNAKGYTFAGAETEYILFGSTEETKNQSAMFGMTIVLRIFFNITNVLKDPMVQSIATAAGAASFGAATPITYVLFILAEAFLDAIVLVNGADMPFVKSYVFLTPAGLVELIKKMSAIKLSDNAQKKLYESAYSCADKMNTKLSEAAVSKDILYKKQDLPKTSYDDYKAKTENQNKKEKIAAKLFEVNYTKTMQMYMVLVSTFMMDTMVRRLADIIQMEASYKAHSDSAPYEFDLCKSYTYLRASGSFSSHVFMKVNDTTSLTSTKRVIYNGY